MTDLAAGVAKAFFDRLNGNVAATVFQHAPHNAAAPSVQIGDLSPEPLGGKAGGAFDRIEVELIARHRQAGVKGLHAVIAAVRARLDLWRPADTLGVAIGEVRFLGSETFRLEDDQDYYGRLRFSCFAQPA